MQAFNRQWHRLNKSIPKFMYTAHHDFSHVCPLCSGQTSSIKQKAIVSVLNLYSKIRSTLDLWWCKLNLYLTVPLQSFLSKLRNFSTTARLLQNKMKTSWTYEILTHAESYKASNQQPKKMNCEKQCYQQQLHLNLQEQNSLQYLLAKQLHLAKRSIWHRIIGISNLFMLACM